MKKTLVATGIVLAMVIMVFAASAKADVSFVGIGAAGADVYGNAWSWNNNGPGGASAWGIPGPPRGDVDLDGPGDVGF